MLPLSATLLRSVIRIVSFGGRMGYPELRYLTGEHRLSLLDLGLVKWGERQPRDGESKWDNMDALVLTARGLDLAEALIP